MFQNRTDAGIQLAEKLTKYRQQANAIVLAIPRGGVPVGYVVARSLQLPMDIVLTKKIGHPMNKEYAIGAASLTDYFIVPHDDVSDDYVQQALLQVRARLREMQEKFIGSRLPADIAGKTVILIDDGVATGRTLQVTVRLIRKSKPARIVIAVPVASDSAAELLQKEADEFISLLIPDYFSGIGGFYYDFTQVSDEEVQSLLEKSYTD